MTKRAHLLLLITFIVAAATSASATGSTGGFLLGGTATHAFDPENPANDVIRIDTAPAAGQCVAPLFLNCPFGTVSRALNVKVSALDNMLEFKYYFRGPVIIPEIPPPPPPESGSQAPTPRSCGGGSPRIQLSIDRGYGMPRVNAFGHLFPSTGCAPSVWTYVDVTDDLPRWDLSQLALPPGSIPNCSAVPLNDPLDLCDFSTDSGYVPWRVLEAVLNAVFPMHKICSGALVDDSSWFPSAAGTAYYDLISLGRATWVNFTDTAGRGFAKGCAAPDHGDVCPPGDNDHDFDHDGDDDEFDRDRRQRWGG